MPRKERPVIPIYKNTRGVKLHYSPKNKYDNHDDIILVPKFSFYDELEYVSFSYMHWGVLVLFKSLIDGLDYSMREHDFLRMLDDFGSIKKVLHGVFYVYKQSFYSTIRLESLQNGGTKTYPI